MIGGEMAVYPHDLCVSGAGRAWPNFGKRFQVRCDTGRSAVKLALQDWQARRDASRPLQVWMPHYICDSVSNAVEQLGLTARRYEDRPGGDSWSTEPAPGTGDLVIIVHYFGLLNRAALKWMDSHTNRGWAVLEDCVQSPYTVAAGERGEYAIASLRKWWPAPDGAVVSTNESLNAAPLLPANEAFASRRIASKLLRGCAHANDDIRLRWAAEAEDLLDSDEPREPAWLSLQLLAGSDPEVAGESRRTNWLELARGLSQHPHVEPVFDHLSPGEAPLVYPILVRESERQPLRKFLQDARVYCPVHWPLGGDAPAADLTLSRRILSIPLDQRYGRAQMQFVSSRINDFFQVKVP